MVVSVDQPWHASGGSQIDPRRARGDARRDGVDRRAVDDNDRIRNQLTFADIEQLAALDGGRGRQGMAQNRNESRKSQGLLREYSVWHGDPCPDGLGLSVSTTTGGLAT